jgi:hypothetical protein
MKIIRQQRLNTQLGNINKTQPLRYTQRFKLIAFSIYLFIPREKIMGEVFKCYNCEEMLCSTNTQSREV